MSFAHRFMNLSGSSGQTLSTPEDRRGFYLTDGVHLYFALGTAGSGSGLISLEDCHSLEVILIPAEELDFLETVSCAAAPADSPGGAPDQRGPEADVVDERCSGRL